jgi:SAM-dependent methyltransferase
VTRAAAGLFERTIAMDLSPRILSAAGAVADEKVAADIDALPLASASVDVVTCFAVLHHLFDCGALVDEVSRVLRPGGAFWSDHDMDAAFFQRFRWPLKVYRRMRAADEKYTRPGSGVDARTYALAEFREDGVDGRRVLDQLRTARLDARAGYHWFGLTPLTNRMFGRRTRSRGWAPLLSIVATKPKEDRT